MKNREIKTNHENFCLRVEVNEIRGTVINSLPEGVCRQ